MSTAVPGGVSSTVTSSLDMAAGSKPESVEAFPVVVEKSSYQICCSSSSYSHNYIGLPYADHNYGARPLPTPPASPPSAVLLRAGEGLYVSANQDDASRGTTVSTSEDSSSYGADITRCICGFTHDDGYMICCDRCSVWQHIDCMRIDRQHIPDTYLCERCQPRCLDRDRAILLQTRKRDNLSDGDTSATESGDEIPLELYTAFQHTPPSILLTATRAPSKPVDKKRKKSEDKEPGPARGKKAFREGSRKSSRVKGPAPELEPTDPSSPWESKMRVWMEHYEEAKSNQYSEDMQLLLRVKETRDAKSLTCSTPTATFKPPAQSQVQKNKKILWAVCDLAPDSLIMEYRGKFMLRQQFEANGCFFMRPYPFVLFYSKFHGLEVCVDSRSFGNEARFVRRSCTPNAEVRHVIEDATLRLYIFSLRHISKGSEVTIGFDYDYGNCKYKVDCACLRQSPECPVLRQNAEPTENFGSGSDAQRHQASKDRAPSSECEGTQNQSITLDCDIANGKSKAPSNAKHRRLSPLRLSISNNQEPQLIEDTEEQSSISNDVEMESEEQAVERRRKMTREERKMEAILQAFARMEKREKRREQALERIGTKTDLKEEPPGTPETESLATLLPVLEVLKEEPAPVLVSVAAKISRSRQRKSLPRSRPHTSHQQRRRARSLSLCSEPPPPFASPGDPAPELPEPRSSDIPKPETPFTHGHSPPATPPHGGSPTHHCRSALKYPNTKKHLVSEWLGERPEEGCPLRVSSDPAVLATQLNALPGLAAGPHMYGTPRHYVRFSSPFLGPRSGGPVSTPAPPAARRRSRELPETPPPSAFCKKRWLRQALQEESSPRHPGLTSPSEGPLSPWLNGDPHSPLPCSTPCTLPDLPAPLKKRRLSPLDSCISEGSTPYGSPCTTPTRSEVPEETALPLATPPRPHAEEQSSDPAPSTPTHNSQAPDHAVLQESESSPDISPEESHGPGSSEGEHTPSPLSSPGLDMPPEETRAVSALSPLPPQLHAQESREEEEEEETGEEGPDHGADAPLTGPPAPSYPCWTARLEKGAPSFASLNSNLRDLTPTHTLDQGQICCPSSEDPHALGGDETEGGIGSSNTPPQKKKVSLLEYRKRQREARESGSNPECSSPVSTVPPLARLGSTAEENGPVAMETAPESCAHRNRAASENPLLGEMVGGEGHWTSSTSVEEAREHNYQRSLQFTDHYKDTDTGETGKLKECTLPNRNSYTLQPCSPDAGPIPEEESAPCVRASIQQHSMDTLTPAKAQCTPTAVTPGLYPGSSLLLLPQASLRHGPPTSPTAYTQYGVQSVPPPPPPSAGSFPRQMQAPLGHFPQVSQTCHTLHPQSSVPPSTPARLCSLATPVLLASSPPPPPPQSQAPQQQLSSVGLLSLPQAQPPPPPPPALGPPPAVTHHFPCLETFQNPAAPTFTFQTHQQGGVLPPPPPPQQTHSNQTMPPKPPARSRKSPGSAPFHSAGHLSSGWH